MTVATVELLASGDENALQFSLAFDPALLTSVSVARGNAIDSAAIFLVNDTQAAQGRIGVVIAFEPGKTFTAGPQEILQLTLKAVTETAEPTASITFADVPVARLIASVGGTVLPANYQSGTVTLPPRLEGDVTPTPNGDGQVNILDIQRVARLVAGLEQVVSTTDFQRADSAPIETKGDGMLTLLDVLQAARYAAGLDEPSTAGGPTGPTPTPGFTPGGNGEPRRLRMMSPTLLRGQTGTVQLLLDAAGNESGVSFSLVFDATRLRFETAELGADASSALLVVNTAQASQGRLGFVLTMSAGQSFSPGTRALLALKFVPLAGVTNGSTPETMLSFDDSPVTRQVGDITAHALAANFDGITLRLADAAVANVSAASFGGDQLAADSIVAAFGIGLASGTESAPSVPLPQTLSGATVRIKDSAGNQYTGGLFYASPGQLNYHLPPGLALGAAQITIEAPGSRTLSGDVQIARIAPGLFTAAGNGLDVAAGLTLRVRDGAAVYESLATYDTNQAKFIAVPIDLSANEDVYLVLYGTGIRGRSDLANVIATIGGVQAEVSYAGETSSYVGLDQLNIKLPRSLAGRGDVEIVLRVDDKTANTVRINIR